MSKISRSYYSSAISEFLSEDNDSILGQLSQKNEYELLTTQRNTWEEEITHLKTVLSALEQDGSVYFEYKIPRMGKRVDVVLLIKGILFVIEYKVGADSFLDADINQTWDYALDLKNFHEGSHHLPIVPILIATDASLKSVTLTPYDDQVYTPLQTNFDGLLPILRIALKNIQPNDIDHYNWSISRYAPTPTIIEAARALYNNHQVDDITRTDASAINLQETTTYIEEVIEHSKKHKQKSICFVTGVPGAGKTLVGLNIATKETAKDADTPAVYLSGNGPLVEVLVEALAADKHEREKAQGKKSKKNEARSKVKAFIQNVHHYRDACLEGTKVEHGKVVADEDYFLDKKNQDKNYAPIEHIAIFDEAQRAWTKENTAYFMRTKKGVPEFPYSEPGYLISCLDRHEDWAVIVCLIGGGQEINKGEAGIKEWIHSLNNSFRNWNIYVSSNLKDKEYANGEIDKLLADRCEVTSNDALHLSVSMRSFRAENLSSFVHHLLDHDIDEAKEVLKELKNYPIVLTRDIEKAKQWLKDKARGNERYGIVVSSRAARLRPLAIDVRLKPDSTHWFLKDKEDIRSSYYLEDVATEFQIQGLELDWTCVVWDGDFRAKDGEWSNHNFVGSKWQTIRQEHLKQYQKNAYRVLLTRARQGMVLVVPEGDVNDPSRKPAFYDETYKYLTDLGLAKL